MGTTLAEGSLSFGVSNLSASFENSNEMTIFDTLTLGSGMNQWLITIMKEQVNKEKQ
jgi:hypothetical protein